MRGVELDPRDEVLEVVVTVKAYPAVSSKYRETVCVAGIEQGLFDQSRHIRLYPVPFRDMPWDQRFEKWSRIRVTARRREDRDRRPESFSPTMESIEVLGKISTARQWAERRRIMDSVERVSMCELQARQKADRTSLGFVDPGEVLDFEWEARPEDERAAAREWLRAQGDLFDERPAGEGLVEEIPYLFRYRYRCPDCGSKKSPHRQSIIDWEIGQAYRSWRAAYGDGEVLERLRSKWLDEICAVDRETSFFAGNMHQHPGSFLVLGCFYPPRV